MDPSIPVSYDQERLLRRIDELTAQVHQLEVEMERSHRLATLGMLAGSIAHEFNNILTPVLSYAQMAQAATDDPALTGKALQKAIDGTEKAAQIASAMLGFVREESPIADAAVRDVVYEALRCMGRDLSKEGIAVDIDVPRECRAAIRPLALEQVIMNLVLNAVEAIRPATGRLRIGARVISGGGCAAWNTPGIIVEVEDSGRGIPSDSIGRIFDPLFTRRADGSSGTGLGLAICKRLIEEAGGTIEVSSRVGEGTTFRLLLPVAAAVARAA